MNSRISPIWGVGEFPGWKLSLVKIARRRKSVYNSWTLFLRRMNATCSFTNPFWGVTRNSSNDCLLTCASESNIEQDLAQSEEIQKILKTR